MTTDERADTRTLAEVDETELLARIVPLMPSGPGVLIGPGDDTALLGVRTGACLATTDTMVRGRDWLDRWSSAEDVGAKVVAQNVADIAAMGGVATGLLVTLVADPATPVAWAEALARGLGQAAEAAEVPVIGGDLSSAPRGVVMVSVTALGELPEGVDAVTRAGARAGDVVAVAGTLGRAAAGLRLLERSDAGQWPAPEVGGLAAELVGVQCRPEPRCAAGPAAARAGATAMIDLSDGLARDAGRVAAASGVSVALDRTALTPHADHLAPALAREGDDGQEAAWDCVLTGGEEHSLLATFTDRAGVPEGFTVIGAVTPAGAHGCCVTLDGAPVTGGWDHFRS